MSTSSLSSSSSAAFAERSQAAVSSYSSSSIIPKYQTAVAQTSTPSFSKLKKSSSSKDLNSKHTPDTSLELRTHIAVAKNFLVTRDLLSFLSYLDSNQQKHASLSPSKPKSLHQRSKSSTAAVRYHSPNGKIFSFLCKDVFMHIFKFLTDKDLSAVASTNRYANDLIWNPTKDQILQSESYQSFLAHVFTSRSTLSSELVASLDESIRSRFGYIENGALSLVKKILTKNYFDVAYVHYKARFKQLKELSVIEYLNKALVADLGELTDGKLEKIMQKFKREDRNELSQLGRSRDQYTQKIATEAVKKVKDMAAIQQPGQRVDREQRGSLTPIFVVLFCIVVLPLLLRVLGYHQKNLR
jgi:hypothetical protein